MAGTSKTLHTAYMATCRHLHLRRHAAVTGIADSTIQSAEYSHALLLSHGQKIALNTICQQACIISCSLQHWSLGFWPGLPVPPTTDSLQIYTRSNIAFAGSSDGAWNLGEPLNTTHVAQSRPPEWRYCLFQCGGWRGQRLLLHQFQLHGLWHR